MKEITVLVPNKVGALAEVTEVLGNQGVNIISIAAQGFRDVGVIRLITSDEMSAMNALKKFVATRGGEGYSVSMSDVLIIPVEDRPGELAKISKRIARAWINIECVYQLRRKDKIVELILKTEDIEKTKKALKSERIKFME